MSSERTPRREAPSEIVSSLLSWCEEEAKVLDALHESVVRGADEDERKVLSSLGGVAKALAIHGNLDTASWPAEINKWMDGAPDLEAELVPPIVAQVESGKDVLGSLYERIVAGKNRRKLGTFFTPRAIMDYITNIVIKNDVEAVAIADPGAGVGVFSETALEVWPDANVHAVDINLVTLGLLAASPELSKRKNYRNLRLWRTDFLKWLVERWVHVPSPRLIFGNPPYTRHQLLSMEEKQAAALASGGLSPSGRSGLSTYFLAASLNSLRPRDSLCLLLPANWLEADYARSVRQHIWNETTRLVEIHLFPDDELIFPGTQVSAMVLFIGPRSECGLEQVIRIYEPKKSGNFFAAELVAEKLRAERMPSTLMPAAFKVSAEDILLGEGTIKLGDVVSVRRGVATGNNKFFLLTNEQVAALPEGSYAPAIARIKEMDEDDFTKELHDILSQRGERCWILRVNKSDRSNEAIDSLLSAGESALVHTAYLCRVRRVWYELEEVPIPHIVVSPMSKRVFRVMANSVGAIPTNTLYGLRLTDHVDSLENRRRLVAWLRSPEGQESLTAIARRHGDGLLKLEPRALLDVKLPKHIIQYPVEELRDPEQVAAF